MNGVELTQAIKERHSVRAYSERGIEPEKREELNRLIRGCNADGRLDIVIRYDDKSGFDSRLAHYGKFKNVSNYIVLAGTPSPNLQERCGYYGEKLVLAAQCMGLNTCWVALSFNKQAVRRLLPQGEKLVAVIAVGYGETCGVQHKGKKLEQIVDVKGEAPDWFLQGARAALLAPTAMNQQKFKISLVNGEPVIKAGLGPYSEIDLGIVKYHFEAASGHKVK